MVVIVNKVVYVLVDWRQAQRKWEGCFSLRNNKKMSHRRHFQTCVTGTKSVLQSSVSAAVTIHHFLEESQFFWKRNDCVFEDEEVAYTQLRRRYPASLRAKRSTSKVATNFPSETKSCSQRTNIQKRLSR